MMKRKSGGAAQATEPKNTGNVTLKLPNTLKDFHQVDNFLLQLRRLKGLYNRVHLSLHEQYHIGTKQGSSRVPIKEEVNLEKAERKKKSHILSIGNK